ncbi:hypothetical protein ACLOJK_023943 [Asimina triloba]
MVQGYHMYATLEMVRILNVVDVMVRLDADQFTVKLFSPTKDFGVCHAASVCPAVIEELSLTLAQEFHVDDREVLSCPTEDHHSGNETEIGLVTQCLLSGNAKLGVSNME